MTSWSDIQKEFVPDGSLRDIYVFETDLQDWQHFTEFVRSGPWPFRLTENGEELPLSDPAQIFSKRSESTSTMLSVFLGAVQLNVHFFCEQEIELDLDPGQVRGEDDLSALVDFMHRLADTIGKSTVLTPENCREIVVLRVEPGSMSVAYNEFGGFHPSKET